MKMEELLFFKNNVETILNQMQMITDALDEISDSLVKMATAIENMPVNIVFEEPTMTQRDWFTAHGLEICRLSRNEADVMIKAYESIKSD